MCEALVRGVETRVWGRIRRRSISRWRKLFWNQQITCTNNISDTNNYEIYDARDGLKDDTGIPFLWNNTARDKDNPKPGGRKFTSGIEVWGAGNHLI